MSGDSNRHGDTDASRADGGNAPPSDGTPQSHGGQAGYAQAGPGVDYQRYAKLGSAVFAVLGFGIALTNFLNLALSSSGGSSSVGGSNQLYAAISGSISSMVTLAPLVALGCGLYLVSRIAEHESGPVVSSVTAGVGVGVILLVLLVLQVVLAPSGTQVQIGDRIAPLIGVIIGVAATGAAGAYVAENLPDF